MYDNRMSEKAKKKPYLNAWVDEQLRQHNRTNAELAKHLGLPPPRVSEIRNGKRKLSGEEVDKIAGFFQSPLPFKPIAKPKEVRLVGRVQAGAEGRLFGIADDPNDFVPMPLNSTDRTVAVEVQGNSLGTIFDRWLVYYDDVRRPVTPDLLHKLCVVGLEDDRVMVKQIMKGSQPNRWNLVSQTEGIIEDAVVQWAAEVRAMAPR